MGLTEEEPVISISGLWMNYSDRMVLRGIDLKVYRGQIIGYIGPNGAGKSTTVKIMLGLVEGYNGTVEIFGQDISSGDVAYKRRIGYVPEVAELYDSLTAREYLTFIGELYGMERSDAAGKAEKLAALLGLDKAFDNRIVSYSKGMKQKVLLISSMLHDPDILFLDEPLSGLDANSVMVVKEIFASLAARGKTIFYSSHIMDVVEKISSRIILLSGGDIIADGSFTELKEMSREGSLEGIFNELTGFDKYLDIAGEFVAVVEGESHEG
ncbi:ABC transporter ATP-binding protein [Paenibacillus donghaensis]|uniref:ABC transporter n=1 Tax=Paenibacillus donghaensis TaxID=414771 RepID=A0A2Z2KK59_9BACL|nr:ABC transporter ATP-binding protein [Paenibacillus donghaensis]ASA24605.1 ABC transporter [Paenibacillus donghaensis]